ncbi:MAG: ADP-ribosylglycohydrolase family protein [Smithellaceae bacterium]|nr:ADP-ribosylglycohydrolase family protein [Smithellaceae bacterium]
MEEEKVIVKTSISHPLRIDEVKVPNGAGIIGMTLCPGKKINSAQSGPWNRDLDMDLKAIQAWGARALVNLMEEHEYELLRVPDYVEKVNSFPMEFYHLPITDVHPPDQRFFDLWKSAGPKLRQILLDGGKILIHCRGGLGRTGTVAAQLLVELGMPHEKAIQAVRDARPDTIETRDQEKYVYSCRPVNERLSVEHFSGCLLGGAVGDALGAAVEFDSIGAIRRQYGENGIENYAPCYGRKGAITDDTQMTLFTAEGLLRAWCRKKQGIVPAEYPEMVHRSYLRWLSTQGVRSAHEDFDLAQNGWLLTVADLHHRRAPGNTCLSALQSAKMGTPEKPINNSKGCGGVMRAAPVGLFAAKAMQSEGNHGEVWKEIFDLGCRIAAITHGHPSGYLPAGCLATIICGIISGLTIEESIKESVTVLKKAKGHEETLDAVTLAMALWKKKTAKPAPETIEKMGGGWVGEEALAISLYCALAAEGDFAKGVRLAVNHTGDSDSTGSITGNILGAMQGRAAIPAPWLEELELNAVIEEIAGDLFVLYDDGDHWQKKYPGY